MAEIAPFSSPGKFYKGNLHTHSNLSDGALAPEQAQSKPDTRGVLRAARYGAEFESRSRPR